MVRLILLGTGTPVPDPDRCGSGVAVQGDSHWILVDCGRGIAQRVIQADLDLCALDAVLLTHHHSDHVSDLASLAIARWAAGAPTPLRVVAPFGPCSRFAERCLDVYEDEAFYAQAAAGLPPRPTITVTAFHPSAWPVSFLDDGNWSIGAALVDHHPIEAAVGYRIQTEGYTVTVSGDTAVCPGIEQLAVDADLLVHEAVRSDRASARLLEWNASAASVGALARSLRLPTVVLTHLLPAPRAIVDEQAFLDEVRSSGYTGTVLVAADLMYIDLARQGPTTIHEQRPLVSSDRRSRAHRR